MTIKDILNTPVSDVWDFIRPFVVGYLAFYTVFFVLVSSFIFYVFIKVIKPHREFDKRKKMIERRRLDIKRWM
jgi:nitrate/nitrite-specific signal transduction histidine kinase